MSETKDAAPKRKKGRPRVGDVEFRVWVPQAMADAIREDAKERGGPITAWWRAVAELALEGPLPPSIQAKVPRLRETLRRAYGSAKEELSDTEVVEGCMAFVEAARDPVAPKVFVNEIDLAGLLSLLDLESVQRLPQGIADMIAKYAQNGGRWERPEMPPPRLRKVEP